MTLVTDNDSSSVRATDLHKEGGALISNRVRTGEFFRNIEGTKQLKICKKPVITAVRIQGSSSRYPDIHLVQIYFIYLTFNLP